MAHPARDATVSGGGTGFSQRGARRCPTFLPEFRFPFPLLPLSVLLATASAPPSGLRHSALGVPGMDARRWRQGRPQLCGDPAACSPSAGARGAFLIGGHTLRGRGAASLNSSPPVPAALPPSRGSSCRRGECCRQPAEAQDPLPGTTEGVRAPKQSHSCLRGVERALAGLGTRARPEEEGAEILPARVRLRTAWGWGAGQSRAQEGTRKSSTSQPAG